LENLKCAFVRRDPGVPTGWWRGVGPTRSVFAVESFMDELAAAARQDPVRYRRALLKSAHARVLDLAAIAPGGPRPAGRQWPRRIIQFAFGSYLAQSPRSRSNAQAKCASSAWYARWIAGKS